WLPDAHSQAPAPVSGLMSGVLLAVALYAILRVQTITDAVIGPDFLRAMLSVAGLLSLFVAAALLIRQRDFKRMLEYA
ncbi:proton-conducting transporter membrane subunit, partial [Glaciimonas sp. Cout2]|uniref:proton-conducting transporter transmembrane domain-containing protein n=1 Tax=Glaciimonas sp. Cout2 TaxID=3048621 RepID=UPI002B231FFC